MSSYVVSPAAEDDIAQLYSHIASDNLHAAKRVFIDLYGAFRMLADMPGVGHTRFDLTAQPLLFCPSVGISSSISPVPAGSRSSVSFTATATLRRFCADARRALPSLLSSP